MHLCCISYQQEEKVETERTTLENAFTDIHFNYIEIGRLILTNARSDMKSPDQVQYKVPSPIIIIIIIIIE